MARCTHLDQVAIFEPEGPVAGCEECLKTGDRWVHLRMCQTCGVIGCCDSSPNRHASRHARTLRLAAAVELVTRPFLFADRVTGAELVLARPETNSVELSAKKASEQQESEN